MVLRKIILFAFLLSFCSQKKDPFELILTKDKSCWVFYSYPEEQINNKKVIVSNCNRFYENNTFEIFQLKGNLTERSFSVDNGSLNEGSWLYEDNLFYIGERRFEVVRFNRDTIVLKNQNDHIQKLVRVEPR